MQTKAIAGGRQRQRPPLFNPPSALKKLFSSGKTSDASHLLDEGINCLSGFFHAMDELDELRNTTSIRRGDDAWPRYLALIGESILSVNSYHNFLQREHPYFRGKESYEKFAEGQLANFYLDLVLAKLKNTFFTEYPNESVRNFFTGNAFDLYRLALNLLDRHHEKTLQAAIAKFYFRLFLYYEFIYAATEHRGAFSTFSRDQGRYHEIVKTLTEHTASCKDFWQHFQQDALLHLFKVNLGKAGIEQYNEPDLNVIFNAYIDAKSAEGLPGKPTVDLEPLSYHLIFKLRKITRFIQTRLIEPSGHQFREEFAKYVPGYVESLVEIGAEFYRSAQQAADLDAFFLATYQADRDFAVNFMYKTAHRKGCYLPNQTIAPDYPMTNSSLTTITSPSLTEKNLPVDFAQIARTVEEIGQQRDTGAFKFGGLFFQTPARELSNLIHGCYQLYASLDRHQRKREKVAIVGQYKSGALLAHCLNLLSPVKKPVFMFTTYPFLAVYPRTREVRDAYNEFLIVDETYKTGFTANVADTYLNRRASQRLPVRVLTLVDDRTYQRCTNGLPCSAVLTRNDDFKPGKAVAKLKETEAIPINERLSAIQEEIETIYATAGGEERFIERLLAQARVADHGNQESDTSANKLYDFTRIMANSDLLFMIAGKLNLDLREKLKQEPKQSESAIKTIRVVTANDEGNLLAEAFALMFRLACPLEWQQEIRICFANSEGTAGGGKDESSDNIFNLFVDFTLSSGLTLAYASKRKNNSKMNYDYIFTVYSERKNVVVDDVERPVHRIINELPGRWADEAAGRRVNPGAALAANTSYNFPHRAHQSHAPANGPAGGAHLGSAVRASCHDDRQPEPDGPGKFLLAAPAPAAERPASLPAGHGRQHPVARHYHLPALSYLFPFQPRKQTASLAPGQPGAGVGRQLLPVAGSPADREPHSNPKPGKLAVSASFLPGHNRLRLHRYSAKYGLSPAPVRGLPLAPTICRPGLRPQPHHGQQQYEKGTDFKSVPCPTSCPAKLAVEGDRIKFCPRECKGLKIFFETGLKSGIQPDHAVKLRVQLTRLDDATCPQDMNAPAGACTS